MIVSAGAAGHSASLIRQYLLQGPAQQRSGSNRGAVAGTVQPDGQAHYVYGEITGYYLHWLASLTEPVEKLQQPAATAVYWLGQYLQGTAVPATRIYLRDAEADWRNQAVFVFDLAMIAGGLARVQHRGLATLPPATVADLQRWLLPFVSADGLKVCLPHSASVVLPQRWSTVGGAFTAKTASRILLLGRQTVLDNTLLAASRAQLLRTVQRAEHHGIDMLHPTLYALEGCLLSQDAEPERLALWFEQIVALQAADGSLPESLQTPEVRRTDIIAQALRVAIFLELLLSQPGRYRDACDKFAAALVQRVRDDGSVAFSNDDNPAANIWCAMFAEQALRLHAAQVRGDPLPFTVDALV